MFHQFPHNFPQGLRLMLSGTDTSSLPPQLVSKVSERLGINESFFKEEWSPRLMNHKGAHGERLLAKMELGQLEECMNVVARQLQQSRHELSIRLYSVWAPVLEGVVALTEAILRQWVLLTFSTERSTPQIEKGECIE